jgi:hypothetical protein
MVLGLFFRELFFDLFLLIVNLPRFFLFYPPSLGWVYGSALMLADDAVDLGMSPNSGFRHTCKVYTSLLRKVRGISSII